MFTLEKNYHDLFLLYWKNGLFQGCRYGQAFYHHFLLGNMAEAKKSDFDNLYYVEEESKAKQIIAKYFVFA